MSEEKIQLPDFLIAELYKGTLVDLDTFGQKEPVKTYEEPLSNIEVGPSERGNVIISGEKIKFLGENKKRVIITINQPGAVFLMEDELTFLTNILKACQLSLADIAIVNKANQEVDFEAIKEQLNAETILLFDVEPSAIQLPFMIPAFQVQKFSGSTIMVAPPLSLINKPGAEGKLLKTKLWLSLKSIFNIP